MLKRNAIVCIHIPRSDKKMCARERAITNYANKPVFRPPRVEHQMIAPPPVLGLCLSLPWMQPSLLFSVSLFFLLVRVALRENVRLYGTSFCLKNPTPPTAQRGAQPSKRRKGTGGRGGGMPRGVTNGAGENGVTVTGVRGNCWFDGERLKLEGETERFLSYGPTWMMRAERWFVSGTGARCRARPRARAADDLSAKGSGLRARQTKGGLHAPEISTPTPAVNL